SFKWVLSRSVRLRTLYPEGVSPHFSRKIFPKYAFEENPHRNPISVTFISVSRRNFFAMSRRYSVRYSAGDFRMVFRKQRRHSRELTAAEEAISSSVIFSP